MERADIIIRGDYVIPITGSIIEDGAVAVRGTEIVAVGPYPEISGMFSAGRTVGGKRCAVMPGLINAHTHAAMVYFRGIADDLPLREWLEGHIWPREARWLGPDFVRDAVQLASLEMLKAGVTTFNDMYFFEDAGGEAVKKLGVRAVLGSGIVDFPTMVAETADEYLRKAEEFIGRWKGDELVTPAVAPHSLYACGPENQIKAAELAEKHGVPLHTHLSETEREVDEIKKKHGKLPVMLLEDLGVLSERLLAAHSVWVTDEEIEVLAKRGVAVAHCVESNLKLASGMAPVQKMLKAGVRVGLGTDGAASNNDLSIFSEMSTAARLAKALTKDPTVLDAGTMLRMATINGAHALGLADRVGSLEPGKAADIIVIDLDKPHLTPVYNINSHLVYSVMASDVQSVIVNGRLVVHKRELLTADEDEILDKARSWGMKIKDGGSQSGAEAK